MLSRDAHGLYWTGRYIERASHICRLVIDQFKAIEDRSVEDVDRGWQRLYSSLGREPVGGKLYPNSGDERIMMADVYTLTDDLIFEPQNPDAILTCFATARKNAQQARNIISHEMWSCLNVAYLDMREKSLMDIWEYKTEDFLLDAFFSVRTFSGIADNTMYQDHGWHFFRLGQFLERALLIASLIDAHIALYSINENHRKWEWGSLLGICEARVSYRRLHSFEFNPNDVLEFLVADAKLSHSLRNTLKLVEVTLIALSENQKPDHVSNVAKQIKLANSLIDYDWPHRDLTNDTATHSLLAGIQQACRLLHNDLGQFYFEYSIEDTQLL